MSELRRIGAEIAPCSTCQRAGVRVDASGYCEACETVIADAISDCAGAVLARAEHAGAMPPNFDLELLRALWSTGWRVEPRARVAAPQCASPASRLVDVGEPTRCAQCVDVAQAQAALGRALGFIAAQRKLDASSRVQRAPGAELQRWISIAGTVTHALTVAATALTMCPEHAKLPRL